MPIYMDRSEIPKEVSVEQVAQMLEENLKVAHLYNCKVMTYWCDEKRRTTFCLIKAPNKKTIQEMHSHAHGEYPHSIIEVDEKIVESFLGRIKDPKKAQNSDLNSIDDPAFRVVMVIETSSYLNRLEANQFSLFTQKFHNSVSKSLKRFKGSVVKKDNNYYLASFKSVSNAVGCALKIQANFKYITPKFDLKNRKMNIGLSAGLPVSDKESIFEEAIVSATRMCEIVKEELVFSNEINKLFENENRNIIINKERARILKPTEEKFLADLMECVDRVWQKSNFKMSNFCSELGYSKSQLYSRLISLAGKSPNNFIKDFRLHKALKQLYEQKGSISEIAYKCGFNSPAYFSKCFRDKYGILPSKYMQQHIV